MRETEGEREKVGSRIRSQLGKEPDKGNSSRISKRQLEQNLSNSLSISSAADIQQEKSSRWRWPLAIQLQLYIPPGSGQVQGVDSKYMASSP